VKDALLLFASLVVSLFLAEAGLRIAAFSYPSFHQHDVLTGSALRPGAEGWYREEGEAYVRINRSGMRDDRQAVLEKADSVYRIAVLGDSYVEALQVDVSKTFWRLLEDKLNICRFAGDKNVVVLNFGVSGYSTAQELLALKHRVKPYHPDLVLLAFLSGNDVRDNSKLLAQSPDMRPFFRLAGAELIEDMSFRESLRFRLEASLLSRGFKRAADYSRVVQLLNKAMKVVARPLLAPRTDAAAREEIGLDDRVYLSRPSEVWEDAWRVTEALVKAIREEANQQGARFLLVTLSNPGQVPPDTKVMQRHAAWLGETDLFYPERRLRAFVNKEAFDAVFLAEPFARHAAEHKVYLHGFPNTQLGGGHWNESGHALAADLIAQHLCAQR
jgi:hypothetical protein